MESSTSGPAVANATSTDATALICSPSLSTDGSGPVLRPRSPPPTSVLLVTGLTLAVMAARSPTTAKMMWVSLRHSSQSRDPTNQKCFLYREIWQEGEPCLAVLNNFYNDGIKWHDVACHHEKPFICEDSEQLMNFVRSRNPEVAL